MTYLIEIHVLIFPLSFVPMMFSNRNICHGSDSVENAEREISLWFAEGVCQWNSHSASWIYEKA